MSILTDLGVTDVFKIYSDYQMQKQQNANASTLADLKSQIAMMSGYVNGQASMKTAAASTGVSSKLSSWMPFMVLGVIGVVAFAVIKK